MAIAIGVQYRDLYDNQEKFWRAVLSRDAAFDGQFVFGVSSTGIYCRPSCPARRARRDRVSFFALPEAAERAGFRACLRCDPRRTESSDPQVELVQRACRLIEERHGENTNLSVLSKHLGLSSFHLQRTFKAVMGITPRQYAEFWRTDRFKFGIRRGESVTSAMYDAGYGSSSRLYERADAELGMTPFTYSQAGQSTTINYTIAKSPLGYLLVATTRKGVCAVRLGESAEVLERDLREEFRAADIRRDGNGLQQTVSRIMEHLAGKEPHLDLPLDIRATAFQRQVWQALRAIPYGETRSYSDVAKEIGRPKAIRAVARACAANPVALAIPCHRVIREDKTLGGYRWGIERKEKLLKTERDNRK